MNYDNIIRHKIEYKLNRAKLQHYEHGENAGKLLALRLKKQMTRNNISSIKMPDNSISVNPEQINKTFRDLYESLYKADNNGDSKSIQDFLDNANLH